MKEKSERLDALREMERHGASKLAIAAMRAEMERGRKSGRAVVKKKPRKR
jgi:hypothetical protein